MKLNFFSSDIKRFFLLLFVLTSVILMMNLFGFKDELFRLLAWFFMFRGIQDIIDIMHAQKFSWLLDMSIKTFLGMTYTNLIFLIFYVYFKRVLSYFFAMIFCMIFLIALLQGQTSIWINLSAAVFLIGIIFSILKLISHYKLKEKLTEKIRNFFNIFRLRYPRLWVLEYSVICFPYLLSSTLFVIIVHSIMVFNFVFFYQVIVTTVFAYLFIYKKYEEGSYSLDI